MSRIHRISVKVSYIDGRKKDNLRVEELRFLELNLLLLQLYVVSAWPFELIAYWRSGLQGVIST